MDAKHLLTFSFKGTGLPIKFVELMEVKDGVVCDVYEFVGDDTKDLGIVRVAKGSSTPSQKVLSGDQTIEGHISGESVLNVTRTSGKKESYKFPSNNETKEVLVNIGDIMQWTALEDLTFYEICLPPYADGRFQDLD